LDRGSAPINAPNLARSLATIASTKSSAVIAGAPALNVRQRDRKSPSDGRLDPAASNKAKPRAASNWTIARPTFSFSGRKLSDSAALISASVASLLDPPVTITAIAFISSQQLRQRDHLLDRVPQRSGPTSNKVTRQIPRPSQHLPWRTRLVEGRHRRWLDVIHDPIDERPQP
jgi:hypothetical protein